MKILLGFLVAFSILCFATVITCLSIGLWNGTPGNSVLAQHLMGVGIPALILTIFSALASCAVSDCV